MIKYISYLLINILDGLFLIGKIKPYDEYKNSKLRWMLWQYRNKLYNYYKT